MHHKNLPLEIKGPPPGDVRKVSRAGNGPTLQLTPVTENKHELPIIRMSVIFLGPEKGGSIQLDIHNITL